MTLKEVTIEGDTLPIKTFKLKQMVENPSIVMIAKRGSGKSWVCRAILKHLDSRGIPGGLIIAKTDKMNPFYSKFFPDLYIHYEYKSDILEKLLYRQEEMQNKNVDKAKIGKRVDRRIFLVMDDCLSSKTTWAKDKPIQEMFYNGRHYEITFVLTMQFPLGIGPELRCNFDYIFLLAEDFVSNQKRLFDHYAGMFPNFDSFRSVFLELTSDFGCMVISNRGNRQSFLDKVFCYTAEETNNDYIGSKQFIKIHKINYDTEWSKRKKPLDINELAARKKKTGSKIQIKRID